MSGYIQVNLKDLSETMGEAYCQSIVSDFSCPLNKDVEEFLQQKAWLFAQQGLAATHLVFASYQEKPVLAGYFTLANKHFHIDSHKGDISNTLRRRISKFAQYDADLKKYIVSAPLIGQLGKNYAHGYQSLLTGDELLELACRKVREIQQNIGGRIVYLECEDKLPLLDFYGRNGFCDFGKRLLEADEVETLSGKYLIQLLRYLK